MFKMSRPDTHVRMSKYLQYTRRNWVISWAVVTNSIIFAPADYICDRRPWISSFEGVVSQLWFETMIFVWETFLLPFALQRNSSATCNVQDHIVNIKVSWVKLAIHRWGIHSDVQSVLADGARWSKMELQHFWNILPVKFVFSLQ